LESWFLISLFCSFYSFYVRFVLLLVAQYRDLGFCPFELGFFIDPSNWCLLDLVFSSEFLLINRRRYLWIPVRWVFRWSSDHFSFSGEGLSWVSASVLLISFQYTVFGFSLRFGLGGCYLSDWSFPWSLFCTSLGNFCGSTLLVLRCFGLCLAIVCSFSAIACRLDVWLF